MEAKIEGEYEKNQQIILHGPCIVLREKDEKALRDLFDVNTKVTIYKQSDLLFQGFYIYDIV